MRYRTSTSQFCLLNGGPSTRAEPLLVTEARALYGPEARKGQLYIVAEAEDQLRAADACQLVIKTIQRGFYEDSSFSVTSALRKAMVRANRTLYDRNFGMAAGQRSYVGVSCAVLRDGDLYVAQVAPAQGYLRARGTLRALPPHPSWNPAYTSATPFVKPTAMGLSLFVEPEFFRATLGLDDGFLLCTSTLARLLSREHVEQLLKSTFADEVTAQLVELCQSSGIPTAHGLTVLMRQPGAVQEGQVASGLGARIGGVGRAVVAWGSSLSGEAAALMRRKQADEQRTTVRVPARPATEPPLVTPQPRPRPIDTGPTLDERHAASAGVVGRDAAGIPPSTFLGERGYQPAPPSDRTVDLSDTKGMSMRGPLRPREEIRPLVDMTLGEKLTLPFQRAAASLGGMFYRRPRRLATPGLPPPRGRGLSYRKQGPPIPWLVPLILIALVAALLAYGYDLSRQNAVQEARSTLDAAEQAMSAVGSAADEAEALRRLDAAQQAMAQVQQSATLSETNSADWLRFQQIQREFNRAQASLLRVSPLDGIETLVRHPNPGGIFSRIILPTSEAADPQAFAYIYAFDRTTGTLYRAPHDGGDAEVLLKPNDEVQGVVVGQLIQAAWRTDSVVAVDRENGSRFLFRSGDAWNQSVLAGSEEWPRDSQIDLEVYQGNVYFWNAIRGQILRYLAGNYGNPADPWISDAGGQNVENSVDMAIDGNVYLLQSDGRILDFASGVFTREITPSGLTPPLALVSHFAALGPPDSGSFLIVDTLNERIVQIDKQSGALIQQMRVPAGSTVRLDQLSDIAVDERGGRPLLYLVNGGQVLRVPLPAPPQPFKAQPPTPVPTLVP